MLDNQCYKCQNKGIANTKKWPKNGVFNANLGIFKRQNLFMKFMKLSPGHKYRFLSSVFSVQKRQRETT